MRCLIPTLLVVISSALLAGCGRDAPGVVMGEDGTFKANSAKNERDRTVAVIDRQLDGQLGGHWRTTATIAELPTWNQDFDDSHREWTWDQATVTVALLGDGTPLPVTEEELRSAVVGFMRPRTNRADTNLKVTLAVTSDAGRFAAATGAQAAAAPAAPLLAGPAGAQSYVVQAGDTLARISAVFYGTTSHWSDIVAANQGLDPSSLRVGQSIVIPALPPAAK